MKTSIKKIKHFINYLYYCNTSFSKNTYPYKLVGERIKSDKKKTFLSFKIAGKEEVCEISLNQLLKNVKMIERFHPFDCIKLGELAFKELLPELMLNNFEKYHYIKKRMLTPISDLFLNEEDINLFHLYSASKNNSHGTEFKDSLLEIIELKNNYPCRLVGEKDYSYKETTIIFTILGKREGYEKTISSLIKNKSLLEKFHSAESIKFGFISAGYNFLKLEEQNDN